jgi:glycosyltransferase involved in cell wall biosynthesis
VTTPLKVVRIIARLNVGGPARHCLLLGGALRERGWEQVLATGDLDEGEASALDREPSLALGSRLVHVPGLGRRISVRDDARALAALVSLLERERPQVVHTHTAKAGGLGRIAARIARVPVVVHTFHGHVLSGYFGPVGSFLACRFERTLARLADRLVVLSERQRDELANHFGVAPLDKFTIVPLGRDLGSFEHAPRGKFRAELGLAADEPLLVYVGRLVPIKDPSTLLQALARTKTRPTLALAGSGPLEDAVRSEARALGMEARVRLLGWRQDLDAILADATALVLSSRNEGTPLAIIEAFAAGTPVVATAVGGVADMFSGEGSQRREGLLVPPGDPAALAEAIDRIVSDPALRKEMSEAGRKRASRYDVGRLADDIDRLYRELLSKTRARKLLQRQPPTPALPPLRGGREIAAER